MKKIFVLPLILVVFISASSFAKTVSLPTGNSKLDRFLQDLSKDEIEGKLEMKKFQAQMSHCYDITEKNFRLLFNKGYKAVDVYLIGLIHKKSGVTVRELVKRNKKGLGWMEISKSLAIGADDLNKLKIEMTKVWKKYEKELKKNEKKAVKDKKERNSKK